MNNNQMNNSNRPKVSNTHSKDEGVAHKVGDSLERLGEKVIKAGAPKLGKAIYNAGNKIEHMNDKK